MKAYHGSAIIFWSQQEKEEPLILVGRRSRHPAYDLWSFPGGTWDECDGYLNKKVNYVETAIRESYEEVGLRVKKRENLIPLWALHLPFFHYVTYAYRLEKPIDPPHIDEFFEVRWFPLNALPKPKVLFVLFQIRSLKKHIKRASKMRVKQQVGRYSSH